MQAVPAQIKNRKKMIQAPTTVQDLENLIAGKIEENINLEYKSADALTDKKEIAKDVSSMANSAGGLIIYGIKEYDEADKNHLPEKITPIDRTRYSREWFEQVIHSNISPKVEGLIIHPVQLDNISEAAFVVEIPQSNTAHQCTSTFRYYKRHNFIAEPMLDYEIRDILNRIKHPLIILNFSIEKKTSIMTEDPFSTIIRDPFKVKAAENKIFTKLTLTVTPTNKGTVYAKYINYIVRLPEDIVNEYSARYLKRITDGYIEFNGENTIRDVIDFKSDPFGGTTKYGPSRFDPILPGLDGGSEQIFLINNATLDNREINWKVHADNSHPNSGNIKLNEIPFVEIDETSK